MPVRKLTLAEAEYIAHALALELMNYINEPIPPFNARSPGILESCLAEPFQTFDGHSLHPSFSEKAAVLFYLVIKNHPFQNGNKRMAITLTNIFCYVNKYWLNIGPRDLYYIACDVAKSEPKNREHVIKELDKGFKKYLTPPSTLRRIIKRA